jgi:hypothetical protein
MSSYTADADKFLNEDEHEKMKCFLAVHPELGEKIAGVEGLRQFFWPIGPKAKWQIVYYFRDLNMPLFLLAIYGAPFVNFDEEFRQYLAKIVDQLVEEYSKQWARITGYLDPIA